MGWGGDDGGWVYSCGDEGCLVFLLPVLVVCGMGSSGWYEDARSWSNIGVYVLYKRKQIANKQGSKVCCCIIVSLPTQQVPHHPPSRPVYDSSRGAQTHPHPVEHV